MRTCHTSNEIEATIGVKHGHDVHRSQHIKDDGTEIGTITDEDMAGDVLFDKLCCLRSAIRETRKFITMNVQHEIRTGTYIQHPSHDSREDGRGGFVDMSDMLCGYQYVADEDERENGYGHDAVL